MAFKSLSFLILIGALAFSGLARADSPKTIGARETRLQAHLAKALPGRGLSLACVEVYVEESTAKYSDFAVREKHDGKCPGDPAVAPIVDRYRVPAGKGRIQTYDVVEDRWR